jgi:hypothetical protein
VVCNIQQTEIYNSSTFNDRLTITNAESSTNLEEDLNFIRSVIFSIYGVDPNNSQNKWYKVPFFTLKYLYDSIESLRAYVISEVNRLDGRIDQINNALNYHINDEFAVEHYTNSENPSYRGQHKNVTARGTLTVYDSSLLKNGLTVEIINPSSDALWVKGKAKIDGALTAPSATLNNLNVNLTINAPSATTVLGNTTVSSLASGGNVSISGTLNVSSSTSLQSILSVEGIATFNNNVSISGVTSINNNLSVSGNVFVGGSITISGVIL